MATMKDVALAAGVSVSTVSHVLNRTRRVDPGTRDQVQAAIALLGYRHNHLARAVARGGRTESIGVALSARSNPYFPEVVTAIDEAASATGSTMLLGETGDDPDRELRLVDTLLQRRVDGIILAAAPGADRSSLPLLAASGTPAVLIDRIPAGVPLDAVGTDNRLPTCLLVRHLAEVHGLDRIGLVSGLPGLSTTDERIEGYRQGVRRTGCAQDPRLVTGGESSSAAAEEAAARLLDLPEPPRALIAGNNAMLVGTMRLLARRGLRVPDDIAVCAFDDFDGAELMAAPLSCIAQDWTRIGSRAVGLLNRRLADPDEDIVVERIPTRFVRRNSCGCTGRAETLPIPSDDPGRVEEAVRGSAVV